MSLDGGPAQARQVALSLFDHLAPIRSTAAAAIAAGFFAFPSFARALVPAPNAKIVGKVLVCNRPGRCLTRAFEVSALDGRGRLVARARTSDADNRYRLSVPAGRYSLLATSNGLKCTGSAFAVAHRAATTNITCAVP